MSGCSRGALEHAQEVVARSVVAASSGSDGGRGCGRGGGSGSGNGGSGRGGLLGHVGQRGASGGHPIQGQLALFFEGGQAQLLLLKGKGKEALRGGSE